MDFLSQAVYKNIANRGLVIPFRTNQRFKRWVLMVMSLALLPAEKITAAWQELRDEAIPSLSPSDKRQLVDFRRYVESYWMCQVTPAVLSVAFTPRRTNNEVEARNRQLNQKARTAHPAPFTMATLIGEKLSTAERDIQAMDNSNPVRGDSRNMFACKESKLLRWLYKEETYITLTSLSKWRS